MAPRLFSAASALIFILFGTIDGTPPEYKGRAGGAPFRAKKVHVDGAYDFDFCREALERREIFPVTPSGIDSIEGLGRCRWVAVRTLAWQGRFRRRRVLCEGRDEIHLANSMDFLKLSV